MKKKMLGYYDYTVILTYCGTLFAFLGILRVIRQDYGKALFCLMLSGVCDMFDGAVAATKMRNDKEKRFGIQIDSLSDLISFGILPGLFVYMLSGQTIFAGAAAALFLLCALIRLAYFNVEEEERQRETAERRKSYHGVPVTVTAILLPVIYLLSRYKPGIRALCFPLLLLLLGIGHLLPVEIKKPGMTGILGIILLATFEMLGIIFLVR